MIETGRIITNYFGLHGTKDTYDEMYRLDVSTHWHKNNSPGWNHFFAVNLQQDSPDDDVDASWTHWQCFKHQVNEVQTFEINKIKIKILQEYPSPATAM